MYPQINPVEVVGNIQPPGEDVATSREKYHAYLIYIQCIRYVAGVLGRDSVLLDDNGDRSRLDDLLSFRDILHQVKTEQLEALVNVVDITLRSTADSSVGTNLHTVGGVETAEGVISESCGGTNTAVSSVIDVGESSVVDTVPEKTYRGRKNARYRQNLKRRKRQAQLGNSYSFSGTNAVDNNVCLAACEDVQSTSGSVGTSDWRGNRSVRGGIFGSAHSESTDNQSIRFGSGVSDLVSATFSDCPSNGTSACSKGSVLSAKNQASLLYWQAKSEQFRTQIRAETAKQERIEIDNALGNTKLAARCRRLEKDNKTLVQALSEGSVTYTRNGVLKQKFNVHPLTKKRIGF